MRLKYYRCEFCKAEFPLLPIAFECPGCGLRHFFTVDKQSCENELFLPEVKCPRERTRKNPGPIKKGHRGRRKQ